MIAFLIGLGVPEKSTPEKHTDIATTSYWRIMFGFPIVVGLIMVFLFTCVFRSDTPKFLAKQGREREAREVFARLYGDDNADEALLQYAPGLSDRYGEGEEA